MLFLNTIGRQFKLMIALFAFSLPAPAATIATNLGPGDSFDGPGPTVGQLPFGLPFTYYAVGFTLAGDTYELNTIEVPLSMYEGVPNEVALFLLDDVSGHPGHVLESFHESNALPVGMFTLLLVNSASQPVLASGQQYWLAVSGGTPTTTLNWAANSIGDVGLAAATT